MLKITLIDADSLSINTLILPLKPVTIWHISKTGTPIFEKTILLLVTLKNERSLTLTGRTD
jgi:hypothetical protein